MRCKVCSSSFKKYYEELRTKGMSIPSIFNETRRIGEQFSEQSLYRHFQSHYNREGIKVISESDSIYIIVGILREYIEKHGSSCVTEDGRLIPLMRKYLSQPYHNSKNELKEALKKVVLELGDYLDSDGFEEAWERETNKPNYSSFNGESFNQRFN